MSWVQWIRERWGELVAGRKLYPPVWLPHPGSAGFRTLDLATPFGQRADWGLSLTDGSRIHVHEYVDGRLVVHRDRHDPDQGVRNLLAHILTETLVGPALLVIGLFALARHSEER